MVHNFLKKSPACRKTGSRASAGSAWVHTTLRMRGCVHVRAHVDTHVHPIASTHVRPHTCTRVHHKSVSAHISALYRHRRRHHCAGMGVPVLKMTTSLGRLF